MLLFNSNQGLTDSHDVAVLPLCSATRTLKLFISCDSRKYTKVNLSDMSPFTPVDQNSVN